jgi:hypothetical protein
MIVAARVVKESVIGFLLVLEKTEAILLRSREVGQEWDGLHSKYLLVC